MKNLIFLIALFLANIGYSQSNNQNLGTSSFDLFEVQTVRSAAAEIPQVTDGTLFSLNQLAMQQLRTAAPENFTLEVPIEHGHTLVVNLWQVEIFSEDFVLQTSGGEDLSNIDLGLHYRGTIQGVKNSVAAISVYSNQIRGVIVSEADNYNLGPIELGSTEYICYKSANLSEEIKSQLDYTCGSVESGADVYSEDELNFAQRGVGDIVRIYVEVDQSIYIGQGSNLSNATAYATSLVNQNAAIYFQEGIGTSASTIFVWTTTDPYDGINGCSTDIRDKYLCDFQAQFNGFNGDLALLLINQDIGGVAAGFSGLCNANADNSMCIAGQFGTTVNTFPVYSYNTYIFAHELGHLFGSRHTHACVWNGNNTAIDGCSATEGTCALPPVPASGNATVMSYCQTQLAGGYIALQPFGSQPGSVIRASVAGATCIGCTSPKIYIPSTLNAGPAVYKCANDAVPTGYVFASSQYCAQNVITDDPFCLGGTGGTWDFQCQDAYNSCFTGCLIYLPNTGTSGPARFVCPGESVPAGYSIAASQPCAQAVVNDDPFCLTSFWDGLCVSAYDACRGTSCTGATTVYLPNAGVTGPAIRGCGLIPVGYTAAASQPCAQAVVNSDPFCLTTNWDGVCVAAYDACRGTSCTGATVVYLPNTGITGPAIRGCGLVPVGYTAAASQPCAQAVVNADAICLTTSWDFICVAAYDACRGTSCTGATTVYLPNTGVTGPAIRGCGLVPVGYTAAASQPCAQAVVNNNPACLTGNWAGACNTAYNACRGTTCTGATVVYLPNSGVTGPAIRGCGLVPVGYTAAASQPCAQAVVNNNAACLTGTWAGACITAYDACRGTSCTGATTVYLPNSGVTGPAIRGCGLIPVGYTAAASQPCAQAVVNSDPFCLTGSWDSFCVAAYDACRGTTCTGATTVYLPNSGVTGPAIRGCGLIPVGYTAAANQPCAQTVVNNDPFCLTTNWDTACQNAYNACVTPVCSAPNNLAVVQIGFGGTNPRVNATWSNPSATSYCEVRGGRISNASYTAGEPEFVNLANTQTITQTNGSTVNFNIALYNNPNIPFVVGARYGYEVRCRCTNGVDMSPWANITPASTFVVPSPPAGVEASSGKLMEAGIKSMSVYPNPADDILNIEIEGYQEGSVDIQVFNAVGQLVKQERNSGTKANIRMDVSDLDAGLYIMSLRTELGVVTERLVIE